MIDHTLKKEVNVMETCPCCGYKTLNEKGGYDICPICFWEDESFNLKIQIMKVVQT